MRAALLAVILVVFVSPATAQGWLTDWEARSEDGETELTGDRAAHADEFLAMLEEASTWFSSMGYRAPSIMERAPGNSAAYLARVKESPTDIVSGVTYWNDPTPRAQMKLTGNLGMTNPSTAIERLMWASPVHELLHASMWMYPGFRAQRLREAASDSYKLPRCPDGTDAYPLGWLNEGASSVLQIRWYERERGGTYGHPFTNPGTAAWVRHFDQPIHLGRVPSAFENSRSPAYRAEREAGRSWRCGYGAWPFWYFVGEELAEEPGQETEYLRYIMEQPSGWEDGALGAVDRGLREAAVAFGSSYRVDEGLFELYPAFIAEYADTTAFYERPGIAILLGGSQLDQRSSILDPLSTDAWEVNVTVPDDLDGGSVPFRVTVESDEERDQLHLIEGDRVIQQPLADEDPYETVVQIRRDTTFLIRLSNVAEEAADTEPALYTIRFEVGGFYGETATDVPEVDIPPGFSVMSGPPILTSCQGAAAEGSVFDLITAAEATGDVRRMVDGGERLLDNMGEALDDGEVYFPGMTAAQRRAMQQAIESGAISPAQLAEMRAAVQEAQGEMDQVRQSGDEAQAELAQEYRDRSRLIMTLVGSAGSETCQILITAGLRGEEGGAQMLSVEDTEDDGPDDPLPVGIHSVGWIVGDVEDMQRDENPFGVCMMTPREQERESRSSCPVVCSGGSLVLEEASQGHARGTLNVDLVRTHSNPNGCPRVERRQLVVGFNITSANSGQDADLFRGMSDETLRALGMDQAQIDAFRVFDGGLFD